MQPLDPVLVEEVRAWLVKAQKDLHGVAIDIEAKPPFLEDALFHFQQAVEKALKGFLAWHNQIFGKTHDLQRLAQQCVELDPTLEPLASQLGRLTKYAWMFRYPGEAPDPTMVEARQVQTVAGQAVDSILSRLPKETRP